MSFPAKAGLKKFPAERYWVNWGSCCANSDPGSERNSKKKSAIKKLTKSLFLFILVVEFSNLN
jgi:hypothetical protein